MIKRAKEATTITTVGELRRALRGLKANTPIRFDGLYGATADSAEVEVQEQPSKQCSGCGRNTPTGNKILVFHTGLCTG